jgi:hypothetical protein
MLNTDTLRKGFEQFFTISPKSAADAADRWVQAYLAYMLEAFAGPLVRNPATDTASTLTLRTALRANFSQTKGRTPTLWANDMQSAFIAFWLAPPQTFIPVPPALGAGVVTIVPPTLASQLLPVLTANRALRGEEGRRKAAENMAFTFDAWTRTIVATITIPPTGPTPVPIL